MLSHGFTAVTFVVINSMATANETSSVALLRSRAADIPVYQETPAEPVWNLLGGKNASILVFDKCNRMAYQLIAPWSSPDHQYVKAAILSAYRDDICGPCNRARDYRRSDNSRKHMSQAAATLQSITSTEQCDQSTTPVSQNIRNHAGPNIYESTSEEQTENNTTVQAQHLQDSQSENLTWNRNHLLHITNNSDSESQTTPISNFGPVDETVTLSPLVEINGNIPIKVIYRDPHTHSNNPGQQEDYVVLQTGNPKYHGHLPRPVETYEELQQRPSPEQVEKQNNSVPAQVTGNDIERLNLTTSKETSSSVEIIETLTTSEPYFSVQRQVTVDDLVDLNENASASRVLTRRARKKKRRKQQKQFRPNFESDVYDSAATTPGIEELVEERQRDIDSEQNLFDRIEKDDIVKLKIIESYRRLLPWLDYDL